MVGEDRHYRLVEVTRHELLRDVTLELVMTSPAQMEIGTVSLPAKMSYWVDVMAGEGSVLDVAGGAHGILLFA